MKTILVTGGAGFIGGNFVSQMCEQGNTVINLDALTYAGNMETLRSVIGLDNHVFVHGRIGDVKLVTELLNRYKPDWIVNFAAESHVDRSIDGPAEFIQTNVVETQLILQCAYEYWKKLSLNNKNAFRFLHVSTDEVYGSLGPSGFFTEETSYAPNSPYSASKASSDHLVRAYHHTYGLPILITNCSNNYGPFQYPEKLIPLTILNALQGEALPIYGKGDNVRDWLYVGDHCKAIECVLKKGRIGENYNIGGNYEKQNIEIVTQLCSMLDKRYPDSENVPHIGLVTYVDDRPGHDARYAIDATKIKNELGWEPEETFQSGIEKTLEWYLDNIDWCKAVTHGTYNMQRLGLNT